MMKNIFISVLGVFLLSIATNAEAVFNQSASKAMSYKNTVRDFAIKQTPEVKEEEKIEEQSYQVTTVDLSSITSESVVLAEHDELEIKVKEVEGYKWKVSYNSGTLIMIKNSTEEEIRTIKFKQKGKDDSSIFLDKKDSSGNTVENKAVYIKVN